MTHKITSSTSVLYDALTLQSSTLTIVPEQVQFRNKIDDSMIGNNEISVNGVLFANFGLANQSRLNSVGFNLSEDDWDTFYAAQTFSHTDDYDNVMQCCLLYIKQNLMPMYGLTSSDWTYSFS